MPLTCQYGAELKVTTASRGRPRAQCTFLLQRAQPALSGLIDGSLSSLAPMFAVASATHTPRYAFYAGLAAAIGAGVSMSFSEGLSDTGADTGRGNSRVRGAITSTGTFIGGFAHAPVPDPLLHNRNGGRDARRDAGTQNACVPGWYAVLQHYFRHLAAQCRARRGDHRRTERCAWDDSRTWVVNNRPISPQRTGHRRTSG